MKGPAIRGGWVRLDSARLPASLGVFELTDLEGSWFKFGSADSRSRFGLRSAVAEAANGTAGAVHVRFEETMMPATRLRELEASFR